MKKYLSASLMVMLLSLTFPVKSEQILIKESNSKQTKASLFTVVPRGTILDNTGDYRIYIDSDSGYYGAFSGGNVTIVIQNVNTLDFFPATSKLGQILNDAGGDYISFGKARFTENGVNMEVFFDGYL